jgi:hypothetical protein
LHVFKQKSRFVFVSSWLAGRPLAIATHGTCPWQKTIMSGHLKKIHSLVFPADGYLPCLACTPDVAAGRGIGYEVYMGTSLPADDERRRDGGFGAQFSYLSMFSWKEHSASS